jgi:hypothetical protein
LQVFGGACRQRALMKSRPSSQCDSQGIEKSRRLRTDQSLMGIASCCLNREESCIYLSHGGVHINPSEDPLLIGPFFCWQLAWTGVYICICTHFWNGDPGFGGPGRLPCLPVSRAGPARMRLCLFDLMFQFYEINMQWSHRRIMI